MALRAVVMSAGVFAVKKKFGDAQPCRLAGIFGMSVILRPLRAEPSSGFSFGLSRNRASLQWTGHGPGLPADESVGVSGTGCSGPGRPGSR